MEIILGLLGIYLVSLLFDNLGFVLFFALGAILIIAVIWLIRNLAKTSNNADKCSAGHCRHCNLGKAKQTGHSANFCYCEFLKEYVQLKSECSYYKSMGCAAGMCDYADFMKGREHAGRGKNVCYCNRLNQYVTAKDSCDLYSDEQTKALLKSLSGD